MNRVKSVPVEYQIKEEGEGRVVEGYASVWGNKDSYGDVMHKGSFAKTLKERVSKNRIKVFYQHHEPVGVLLEAKEDDTGLWTKARISKTSLGDDVLELIRDKAVDTMSFGYSVVKEDWDDETKTNNVREVRLMEVSYVPIPANEEAMILSVKSMEGEGRRVARELASLRKSLSVEEDGDEVVKVGSSVSWNSSGGSDDTLEPPAGKVVSIHTDGPVPGIDADVMGTGDEPAARIRVWSQDDEGAWSPTDTYVGHKVATLKPRSALQEEVSGGGGKSAALLLKAREVIEELKDALQANAEEPSEGIPGTPHREDTPLGAMEPQKDAELYRKFREELDSMKCITDTEGVHPQQKGTI